MSNLVLPRSSPTPGASAAAADARPGPAGPSAAGEVVALALQALGALFALAAVAALVDRLFHDELVTVAPRVVEALGIVGVGLGTLLADGLHVPVPPQAYMVAVAADGRDEAAALAAICVGSLGGGVLAYGLATWASRVEPIRARTAGAVARLTALRRRFGARAVFVAAALPIPYSFLCYAAGLSRLARRDLAVLLALRVPKLLVYYAVVKLALAR